MAVFRFLAFVFLLIAVLALVADATPWSYGVGPFVAKSLSEHAAEMAPTTLSAIEGFLSREAPWMWGLVVKPVLQMPTALFFGLASVLSGYVGRRRSEVEVFVN